MFEFLFDIPLLVAGPGIILSLCLFGGVGVMGVRRWVLPRLRVQVADSEFVGAMLQSIMVFYGLAVALIAVSVWQTYTDVSKIISGEASALNALYRDVTSYPEPIRLKLQNELRDYLEQVIHHAWPLQRQGEIPTAGLEHMSRFQSVLDKFEPASEGQKLLHGETLRAYNQMIQARRLRLDSIRTGLPGVMWIVVILGALIGISASFFFKVNDARLHGIQVLLLATFIGLVIFMILAFDRPFRGDLAQGPDAYQLLYNHLMKGNP